jgi:sodium-independent sulfate anion transporter 11
MKIPLPREESICLPITKAALIPVSRSKNQPRESSFSGKHVVHNSNVLNSTYQLFLSDRVSEGFNYPNANHYTDHLVSHIFATTRRTNPQTWGNPGDRPWNDPGPTRAQRKILLAEDAPISPLPTLKAVILDFASVNNVDVTSVQNLIDVRNQLDRWASPDTVQWHFAHVQSRWTKRALAAAGFGWPAVDDGSAPRWQKGIFDVAEIVDGGIPVSSAQSQISKEKDKDLEVGVRAQESSGSSSVDHSEDDVQIIQTQGEMVDARRRRGRSGVGNMATVDGINRPWFHVDLTSALKSAMEG